MENFAILTFLILFIASFFQHLFLNKIDNLSLGFRIGKFRDGDLFEIIYGFIFPNFWSSSKTNNLNLEITVGKFRQSGLF